MDWVPIIFGLFKLTVLLIAAFFAIKWHYDQDKKKKASQEAQTSAPVATHKPEREGSSR
ncbi:MAG: hypothetical protein Q4B17_00815 [Lautropia sp.]|nr:hypothetical protein [Lautropia sp.]